MARRTVKVELYVKQADKFLDLCQTINDNHELMGRMSPLADGFVVNMTQYKQLLQKARLARERALQLYAEAERAMKESYTAIGTAKGQTSDTPNTLYNATKRIKQFLLTTQSENPTNIKTWGFDVVVGQAKPKGKHKSRKTSQEEVVGA